MSTLRKAIAITTWVPAVLALAALSQAAEGWTPTTLTGAPIGRANHSGVWTGTKLIVWGGTISGNVTNTGGIYDPVTNSWTPMSTAGAPEARKGHKAVWTGSRMIVWGGDNVSAFKLDTGGVYDPVADTWTPVTTTGAPSARRGHSAVWTGSKMVVWGGEDIGGTAANTGGVYDPDTDTWTPTSLTGAPSARSLHTAVWTASRMIVWGGAYGAGLGDGGVYDPDSDTWTPTSLTGAPSARHSHTAVWTGSTMIVWGGQETTANVNTGGIYDPAADTWTATATTGAVARRLHVAVWTGTKMIVWGGWTSLYSNTGGVYDPATGVWMATTTTGAPTGRAYFPAEWTGQAMVLWGGIGSGSPARTDTGGLYTPAIAHTLTVSTDGTGSGSVASSPAGISCGSDCTEVYADGTSVTLTPTAAVGSTFTAWSGACTGTDACVVAMDAAKSVTATFTADIYTLTASTDGTGSGTVTSSPAGIVCGADCTEAYGYGTMVTLTANPGPGSHLESWSGACSGIGDCVVSMVAARSVTATFTLENRILYVVPNGEGSGRVTSSPAGIDCGADCDELYLYGTAVTLTAAANAGSIFTGWAGNCDGSGECSFTMDAPKVVYATFGPSEYTLTVARDGTGSGTVTSSPAGIDCGADCGESYATGAEVTLTATAATGSVFAGWSGDCAGTGACVITMGDTRSVTATFDLARHELSVTTDGTGSGTVTSLPAGIDCGADCSEPFDHGTIVTLTPSADAGSSFTGWGGDCSGSGACTVTMDAARSVTATFTPTSFPLAVTTDGKGSGTVTSSPAGIDCGSDCDENFDTGAEVTLTATAAIGSVFAGWSGDCSGTGSCTVTLSAARSVTATFDEDGGTGFYTVTPCRVADTRLAAGPSGAPSLPANTARSFPVAGLCGVPTTARAVAVNVTVVNATSVGNLRLYPAGGAVPLTSTINFIASLTRANNAVIPLGTGGEMAVTCSMPAGSTDFVLDVTGYFE